jgi:uncharacterized protein
MSMIDFHVHAGDFYQLRDDIQGLLKARPMEPDQDVRTVFSSREALEAYLSAQGVTRAIVLAECGPGTNFSITSEMIARLVGDSDMLIPFGSINPNYHANPVDEWQRSVAVGVRGFKFYPADHSFNPHTAGMMEVYRLCAEAGLPVVFHTGTTAQRDALEQYIHPHEFLPILEANPDLVCVLAHAGKPDWCEEALAMTERFPNCYVDTALVGLNRLIDLGLETRPARHKVLFGSDWPVCGGYTQLMGRLEQTSMSAGLRQAIMHDNAAALLARLNEHSGAVASV